MKCGCWNTAYVFPRISKRSESKFARANYYELHVSLQKTVSSNLLESPTIVYIKSNKIYVHWSFQII
jgi:hypothetical protein